MLISAKTNPKVNMIRLFLSRLRITRFRDFVVLLKRNVAGNSAKNKVLRSLAWPLIKLKSCRIFDGTGMLLWSETLFSRTRFFFKDFFLKSCSGFKSYFWLKAAATTDFQCEVIYFKFFFVLKSIVIFLIFVGHGPKVLDTGTSRRKTCTSVLECPLW